VQRTRQALEPARGLLEAGALCARLGSALGLEGFDGGFDVVRTSRALAAALPAFAGTAIDELPEPGRPLSTPTPGEEA